MRWRRRDTVSLMAAILLVTLAMSAALAAPPQPERKVTATGAIADLDDVNHTVRLSGGAKLTTAEGTITSREINARLDARNSVQTAQAEQEVKLDFRYTTKEGAQRRMQGSADRAIYTAAERTVQLLGHVAAELTEPGTRRSIVIAAEDVTFWIDEGRLRIRPADIVFTEMVEQPPKPAPAGQK